MSDPSGWMVGQDLGISCFDLPLYTHFSRKIEIQEMKQSIESRVVALLLLSHIERSSDFEPMCLLVVLYCWRTSVTARSGPMRCKCCSPTHLLVPAAHREQVLRAKALGEPRYQTLAKLSPRAFGRVACYKLPTGSYRKENDSSHLKPSFYEDSPQTAFLAERPFLFGWMTWTR